MKKLFIIVFTALVLISCKKEKETSMNLLIQDYYTGQPIPNYKCILHRQVYSLFHVQEQTVDTFITNSNGRIDYTFPAERNFVYYIKPIYNSPYSTFEESILKGEDNSKTIEVKKCNVIQLQLINKTGEYKLASASFNIPKSPNINNSYYSTQGSPWNFTGSVPDEPGSKMYIRLYKGYNDDHPTLRIDSAITIPNVDTVKLTFEY
jgi:hypothetical protein